MIAKRLALSALSVLFALYLAGCGGSSQPISVSITASATTVDGVAGNTVTLTASVAHDKATGGVSWAVSGGGTISSTSTSATYTPPAAGATDVTATVTATSVADSTKTGQVTIKVPAAPTVATTSFNLTGAVGAAYSVTLGGSGGIPPYKNWALASTSSPLPSCLTLSSAGVITTASGTAPMASCAGTYDNLIFTYTDSGTPNPITATSAAMSIVLAPAPPIVIGNAMMADGTMTVPYSTVITATGGAGPLTYSVASGAFPDGVTMGSNGLVSGTPTKVGDFAVTVRASDAFGDSGTQAYTIHVGYPALVITQITPAVGYVGTTYPSTTLTATGGSGTGYTWSVMDALPGGLSISTTADGHGSITGKPTTAGTMLSYIKVTDSVAHFSSVQLGFTIKPAVSITTATALPTGYVGSNYSQALAATGGAGSPYTWAVASGSTVPAGLTLSSAGVLSGKPTVAGTPSFAITATDSASNSATATFTMTIAAAVTITTPTTLPATFVGATYSQTLAASGGSGSGYTWAVSSGSTLPAGLSLSTAGVLSGKPTAAATTSFGVTVTDSVSNTATTTFSLTVSAGVGITTTSPLPTGYVGANYSQTLQAGGGTNSGFVWAVTAGGNTLTALNLTLSSGGVLSGTPASTGTASFTVSVTDSASNTAPPVNFTLTVKAGVTITTGSPLPTGYISKAYSQTLAATGGSGAGYTWAVTSGASSLTAVNLTLSNGGVLSGTPAAAGNATFSVTVTDSASNTASATFSVTVNPGITINSITLPKGYQGTVYAGATFSATGGSNAGYNWTWAAASGSSLPAGLNLSAAGAVSGTPSGSGTFSVVVTVTDSASNTASQTYSLVVEPTLSITTSGTLKSGTINTAYTTTLAATGGSGTYSTWTVTQGGAALQTLSLSLSSTGVLSGTPTVAGSATFTAQVTDSESHTSTASLTVTIYSLLTITTSSLPAGSVGASYSQTLAAGGGSGTGYTWSATGSNLATYGLTLSSAGVVSGTPTTNGTASFTPKVTDSGSNTATAAAPLTIQIYGALSLPTSNPGSLPSTGTTGVAYTGSINATGGSGNYCWTVTGLPFDGVSSPLPNAPCGYISASLPISGTPTGQATITFTASVKDTTTNLSVGPYTYTITITNPAPLVFTTSTTLPSGTVTQAYTQIIAATGGVGPYTWAINGSNLPGDGSNQPLSDGLTVSSNGTLNLGIGGTPTAISAITFTAKITDSLGASAGPTTFTIQVDAAGSQVSGQIMLSNTCGGGNQTVPPIQVSINTNPVQTVTTDNNGNYTFDAVPNGTYKITPSISGPSSLFYPLSIANVVVNNGPMNGKNFSVSLGYTVSGTVNYGGSKTGPIYLYLNGNNCGGNSSNGTSIAAAGSFNIRGVAPGTYTLNAWRDNLGYGQPNASNPTGSLANLIISTANLTGQDLKLSDSGTVTLSTAPGVQIGGPFSNGVVLGFNAPSTNNVETATSYTVQWSASSSINSSTGAFSTVAGSHSFAATGANGSNVWIVNKANVSGLNSGSSYYFQAQGVAGSSTSAWSAPVGPVTIAQPTAANTITGQVTWTGTAKGPLYVGFYQPTSGGGALIYGTQVGTAVNPPTSPASFSIEVPSGSYGFFGALDQNNDGMFDIGDITNTGDNGPLPVVISGSGAEPTLALPSSSSTAVVTTTLSQYSDGSGGTSTSYNLEFTVAEGTRLPVAVTLTSGPNVINPIDIARCHDCGTPKMQYGTNLGAAVPKKNDSYNFNVTYADTTTGTVTATVTGVLTSSALATLISPTGNGVSDTPNFDWNYPASAASYTYQFWLCCGNNGQIWQIPGQNSNSKGFNSSQITPPLVWGADPTNSNNQPSPSSLSAGVNYSWTISAQDVNGNQAQAQGNFSTTAGALTLPTSNPSTLPSAVVNTAYNGSIAATGGLQPYSWTVTGLPGDNLNWGSSDSCGCVTINGTPNSVTAPGNPVSFQVTVHDSNGASYGPITYTIDVNSYTAISLPAASSNPLGSALVGTTYAGSINASGGSGGGNYSFTVNGTAIPTNNTATAIANGGGLTANNSGGDTLFFGGTPSAAGTITLDVIVTDTAHSGNTAEVTYTVSVISGPDGSKNSRLNGTYSCLTQGFNDSDGSRWASVAKFVAHGNGTIDSGVWDMNGRALSGPMSGTVTGTYSVGSDNNGLMSLSSVVTAGSSGTQPSAWAIALTGSGTTAQTFRMVETDDTGSSPSGQYAQGKCYQDTTGAFAAGTINGNSFAFAMQGENGSGVPKAYVGRMSASNGNISSGSLDGMRLDQSADNGGSFAGSYTAPDTTTGRFTFTITPTGSSTSVTFAGYIVDANRMFLLETAGDSGLMAGDMRRQQNTANYTAAGLTGGMVVYTQGMLYSATSPGFSNDSLSQVIQVSSAGNGSLAVNASYQDETGTYKTCTSSCGAASVMFDSTNVGRATFSVGKDTVYMYFFNTNNAFYLDLSNGWVETGWLQSQSQIAFTDAAIAGPYMMGQMPRLQTNNGSSVGELTVTSSGALNGGISNGGPGSFSYDQAFSSTYTWDSATYGTFLVSGTGGKGGLSCVVVSPTNTICTLQDDSAPSILIFQQ